MWRFALYILLLVLIFHLTLASEKIRTRMARGMRNLKDYRWEKVLLTLHVLLELALLIVDITLLVHFFHHA